MKRRNALLKGYGLHPEDYHDYERQNSGIVKAFWIDNSFGESCFLRRNPVDEENRERVSVLFFQKKRTIDLGTVANKSRSLVHDTSYTSSYTISLYTYVYMFHERDKSVITN